MNIEINPKIIFIRFLYIIFFLLFANLIGIISKFYFDHDHIYGLIPLFNFNLERNIPTLYSSFAIISCSILLGIIAYLHKRKKSSYAQWTGLSLIFLFLSIDEMASIHELLTAPVSNSLNTSGFLLYAWVIPYGIALVVFLITYFSFLMGLPKRTRNLFIVSGTIFVTGAIGFELLGGWQADSYGIENLTYAFTATCEEFLEMLGIIIFIYALLHYLATQFEPLTISLNK